LSPVVETLVDCTEGPLPKFLAAFDRLKLFAADFVDLNPGFVPLGPLAVGIKDAREVSPTGGTSLIKIRIEGTLVTMFYVHVRGNLRSDRLLVAALLSTALPELLRRPSVRVLELPET